MAPEQLRAGLHDLRAATNRPVNANFFVHAPPTEDPARRTRMEARHRPYYGELGIALPEGSLAAPPPFSEAVLEVVLRERPSVVGFHKVQPEAAHPEALRDAGIHVLRSATTVEEARWLEAQRVAAVIARATRPVAIAAPSGARSMRSESAPARVLLLVRTERPTVIHHRRGDDGSIATRIVTAGALALDPPGLTLALGAIYG